MNLLLGIKLVNDILRLTPESRNVPDGYTLFDLDNFSDGLVVSTALKAIEQSDEIHFEVSAEPESKLGPTLKVINALLKFKGPLKIVFKGEHQQLEKMLKQLNRH